MNPNLPSKRAGVLRLLWRAAITAGAAGSVVFTLMVGRHNQSPLLVGLFTGWVLAPFAGLVVAGRLAPSWSTATRAALHLVAFVVAAGSLLAYGTVALGPPRPKPAAVFLLVPLVSWLLGLVVVTVAALISCRRPADPVPRNRA